MDEKEAFEILDRIHIRFRVSDQSIRNMNNSTFNSLFRFFQFPIREHVSRNQSRLLNEFRKEYELPQ